MNDSFLETPRILNCRDVLRMELEFAIQKEIPIIPVLIGHARMPHQSELPHSLESNLSFSQLQAVKIDIGKDFHHHVDGLIHDVSYAVGTYSETAK